MTASQQNKRPRRWLVWIASGLAGLMGFKYGYDFGERLSGTVLGVIAGVNLAVMCGFVGGSAAKRIAASRAAKRDRT
jgi:hypothetical protein